jgi:hypothetical protein
MPVRIILIAKNIAIGTEVLAYALHEGCAVEQVLQIEPPIGAPKAKAMKQLTKGTTGYKRGGKLELRPDVSYGSGTLRAQAYEMLCEYLKTNAAHEPKVFIECLEEGGWSSTQARQVFAALKKTKGIVPVP